MCFIYMRADFPAWGWPLRSCGKVKVTGTKVDIVAVPLMCACICDVVSEPLSLHTVDELEMPEEKVVAYVFLRYI